MWTALPCNRSSVPPRPVPKAGSTKSVVPVKDLNGLTILAEDEFIKSNSTVEGLAGLQPSFMMMGEMGGFNAVALQKYHWVEKIDHVHTPLTPPASLMARRCC
jgi:acetyl-CoA acetyltransferase